MQFFKRQFKAKRRLSQEQLKTISVLSSARNSVDDQRKFKHMSSISLQNRFRKSVNPNKENLQNKRYSCLKMRNSQGCASKLDKLQFQKKHQLNQLRKPIKHKYTQSLEFRSTPDREKLMFNQSQKRKQVLMVQESLQKQRKFSLLKESLQIKQQNNQIRKLNILQFQEKTKTKLLKSLIQFFKEQESIYSPHNQKSIAHKSSIQHSEEIMLRLEQRKIEDFIKKNNQVIEEIHQTRKTIIALRSDRVAYSCIFKELEKEIKLAEIKFFNRLMSSLEEGRSLCLYQQSLQKDDNTQHYVRSDESMNSYNPFKFGQFMNGVNNLTDGVNFSNWRTNFQTGNLDERINSNTALNYYTQSRKVIIMPRYKEHHQSSRKQIKIERQQKQYRQLVNQTRKIFIMLQIIAKSQPKSDQNNQNTLNCMPFQHNGMPTQSLNEVIQKIQHQVKNIPLTNQQILSDIESVDEQIAKFQKRIKCCLKTKANKAVTDNDQLNQKYLFCSSKNLSLQLNAQLQIQNLETILGINQLQSCDQIKGLLETIDSEYLAAKTIEIFQQKDQSQNTSSINKTTDRSKLSKDQCSINQDSVISRGPTTVNSLLKNIQVYDSYERAFQRMDFENQYQSEKNKKKRTLIRRPGMVSLGLLKKQAGEKGYNKFSKRYE